MDKLIRRAVLFDYYGGLLNEKQKSIASGTVAEDLSLSEIGEQEGITRQAVSETLKRIDDKFEKYEETLGLIRRAERINSVLSQIRALADRLQGEEKEQLYRLAEQIAEEI